MVRKKSSPSVSDSTSHSSSSSVSSSYSFIVVLISSFLPDRWLSDANAGGNPAHAPSGARRGSGSTEVASDRSRRAPWIAQDARSLPRHDPGGQFPAGPATGGGDPREH